MELNDGSQHHVATDRDATCVSGKCPSSASRQPRMAGHSQIGRFNTTEGCVPRMFSRLRTAYMEVLIS